MLRAGRGVRRLRRARAGYSGASVLLATLHAPRPVHTGAPVLLAIGAVRQHPRVPPVRSVVREVVGLAPEAAAQEQPPRLGPHSQVHRAAVALQVPGVRRQRAGLVGVRVW